jgi:hypothetical protein
LLAPFLKEITLHWEVTTPGAHPVKELSAEDEMGQEVDPANLSEAAIADPPGRSENTFILPMRIKFVYSYRTSFVIE